MLVYVAEGHNRGDSARNIGVALTPELALEVIRQCIETTNVKHDYYAISVFDTEVGYRNTKRVIAVEAKLEYRGFAWHVVSLALGNEGPDVAY